MPYIKKFNITESSDTILIQLHLLIDAFVIDFDDFFEVLDMRIQFFVEIIDVSTILLYEEESFLWLQHFFRFSLRAEGVHF